MNIRISVMLLALGVAVSGFAFSVMPSDVNASEGHYRSFTWTKCNWNGPSVYNTLKVRRTNCRTGNRVGKKGRTKLCRKKSCSWTTEIVPWKPTRGVVWVGRWKCRVTAGWEWETERCRKGTRRLYRSTGV